MDYIFLVNVNYPSYMQTQIVTLNLGANLIDIGTDSSTSPMTVDLAFDGVLSNVSLAALTTYMNSYTDPVVTAAAIALIQIAMNVDANVILVARTRIKQTIPSLDVLTLLQLCTLLGVNPSS